MARLEYFLVAESAIVDTATNKTTIVNVIEEFAPPHFPVVVAQEVAVISLWRAEAGDYDKDFQVLLRVKLPNGESHDFPTNFRFQAGVLRHRIIQRLAGIPIPSPGEVVAEILLNGKHVAEHVITVTQGTDPSAVAKESLQ